MSETTVRPAWPAYLLPLTGAVGSYLLIRLVPGYGWLLAAGWVGGGLLALVAIAGTTALIRKH